MKRLLKDAPFHKPLFKKVYKIIEKYPRTKYANLLSCITAINPKFHELQAADLLLKEVLTEMLIEHEEIELHYDEAYRAFVQEEHLTDTWQAQNGFLYCRFIPKGWTQEKQDLKEREEKQKIVNYLDNYFNEI